MSTQRRITRRQALERTLAAGAAAGLGAAGLDPLVQRALAAAAPGPRASLRDVEHVASPAVHSGQRVLGTASRLGGGPRRASSGR
jgi:hypothetical protein